MKIICRLFGHRFYEEGYADYAPYIPKQCPRCAEPNPLWNNDNKSGND